MRNKIAILVIFLFFPLSLVFGQNQRIIPLSSSVYNDMDTLYLLRGLGTPSTARPWTTSEAQMILERVDANLQNGRLQNVRFLGRQEQTLYDSIAAEIYKPLRFLSDNAFNFDVKLDIALEAYTHVNTDDYVLNGDWNYGYEERQALAKFNLEMSLYSRLYIFTDFGYNRNRLNEKDEFRNFQDLNQGIGSESPYSALFPWKSWAYSRAFITNIPTSLDEFDFDWPKRANFTVGGQHWNLSLARDRIQWGRGKTGNFIVDGHRDYDEYFRVSAFSDRFKYEWLNVFYDVPEAGGDSTFKFLMAHRLEFRILPSLVFAVSENVMCRPNNFNPRYINPAFIYHSWYDRDNLNSIAHLELDFAPFRGYRLYTQAAFDQIQAPWENSDEPAAWGILAGIEHARPLLSGVLSLSFEGAYTTPLMYRRDLLDFVLLGSTEVNNVSHNLYFDYTGFPYGGDAIVFQFDANYRFPCAAFIHARLFTMIHGKMNYFISHNKNGDNTGYANLTDRTPSGGKDEKEYTFAVSLDGNYTIPQPLSWLKLRAWAELDFICKKNKLMLSGDVTDINEDIVYHKKGWSPDFQFVLGVGISF